MSVAVRPGGAVYVATRREVILFQDDDGDARPDRRTTVLTLDTPGDYPHNGLAGLAFDALGSMYIGLGENLGAPYKLIGTDGKALSGEAEGGSLYRCRLDGTGLTRVATGFWNPHASCLDAFGRLFTVDNDPDSRPPCRLLHIVPGGDYGYRFRNGRRGTHPFTAWDGELPGTLPMVAGTGEAPSGIVAYESDALPEEFRGNLLATSWGDHRIERFRLKAKGASFTSVAEPLIRGGENFRPVGLAVAPDGSLYCSDWVLKDYNVHGQGRVWRIRAIESARRDQVDVESIPRRPLPELSRLVESPRIEVRRAAAQTLSRERAGRDILGKIVADRDAPARARIEALWALLAEHQAHRESSSGRNHAPANELATLAFADDEVATAFVRHAFPAMLEQGKLSGRTTNWCLWFPFTGAGSESGAVAEFPVRLPPDGPGFSEERLRDELRQPTTRDPLFPITALQPFLFAHADSHRGHLTAVFEIDDPFVFGEAIRLAAALYTPAEFAEAMQPARNPSAKARLGLLLAARRHDRNGLMEPVIAQGLHDPDPAVQRAAVQWVGEELLADFRAGVEQTLESGAATPELLEATLASLDLLEGVKRAPKDESSGADYMLKLMLDEGRPASVRALAARMIPPDYPGLESSVVGKLLADPDEAVRREAVRLLPFSPLADRETLLVQLAADEKSPASLRADAVAGLANVAPDGNFSQRGLELLIGMLESRQPALTVEALRVLRAAVERNERVRSSILQAAAKFSAEEPARRDAAARSLADQLILALQAGHLEVPPQLSAAGSRRPTRVEEWLSLEAGRGDLEAGRRVFFSSAAAGCARCHTVQGRGGRIGPDLSVIARTQDRAKLAESILIPSKEIAPQFTTWTIVTRSGRSHSGLIVAEDRAGKVRLGTAEGELIELAADEIEERLPQKISIMPDKLVDRLTVDEFRNVLAFLQTLK